LVDASGQVAAVVHGKWFFWKLRLSVFDDRRD
jgi:hypothetical protein